MAARHRRAAEEAAYRAYVTESLRMIPQSRYFSRPFLEVVRGSGEPEDARSGDEVAADVIARLGLEVV